MPRDAGKPSVANLRSSAQAVRSAISGQNGAIADALTAIAGALDQVQAAVESLEGKNRELASPDTNDPRRRSTAYVSGDRIVGGVSVQGSLQTVAGQSLDLTLQNQVARIAAIDHNTGGSLELDIAGSPLTLSSSGSGKVILRPGTDSTTAVQVQNAAGTVAVMDFDTTNLRVGIGTVAPGSKLEVSGVGQVIAATATGGVGTVNYGFLAQAVGAAVGVGDANTALYVNAANASTNIGVRVIGPAAGTNCYAVFGDATAPAYFQGKLLIGTSTSGGSPVRFSSIPVFANNAAAVGGGLVAGDLYRTGGNPDPICIVH